MHKKLETDLISLAHSVLQLKNKEDVLVLKQKAYEIYEKLAVLAYVEEYINTTPNATETKEELIEKIEVAEKINKSQDKRSKIENTEKIIEQPFDELEEMMISDDDFSKDDIKNDDEKKIITLDEELEDTIPIDVAADLFGKSVDKKSLNDHLKQNLQIGLNDRIAFVKNLFKGSQEDFNRVVSQINTFKTEKEAKKFIKNKVKPDYNWDKQEEYEERFMTIIECKFV